MRVIESLNPIGATEEVFFSVTEAMLTSSTVPEEPPALYNGGTTYDEGDEVSVAGSANAFTVYRSLVGSNVGNTPASSPDEWENIGSTHGVWDESATYALGDRVITLDTHLEYESLAGSNTAALTDTTKWSLKGPNNRWRMFDLKRNQVTTVPKSLTVEIQPGKRVDAIGAVEVAADSYTVEVEVGGSVVFSETASLSNRNTVSWSTYFFGEFSFNDRFSRFDLPPYSGALIRLTLTRASGSVSIGRLVVNKHVFLGDMEMGAEDDALNFSTVTRSFDGESNLVPRRSTPTLNGTVWVEKENVRNARALRNRIPATPALWVGLRDEGDGYYESVTVLGFYTEFTIRLDHPTHAPTNLKVEEA